MENKKMREINTAKLKILQKLKQIEVAPTAQGSTTSKKAPPRKQNAQIRKKVDTNVAKSVATSVPQNISTSGQNVISISGRPMLANPVRIKGGQQQIIIQSTTNDGQKLQIIDPKHTKQQNKPQQSQQPPAQQQVQQPNTMDILRQIQSERKGGKQTLSFGGKTANMAQIRMITAQPKPNSQSRVLQVSSNSSKRLYLNFEY